MPISNPVELRSTGQPRRLSRHGICSTEAPGTGRLPCGPLTIGCAGSQNSIPLSAILLKGYRSNWQAADGLALPPGLGRIQVGKSSFYQKPSFHRNKSNSGRVQENEGGGMAPQSPTGQ